MAKAEGSIQGLKQYLIVYSINNEPRTDFLFAVDEDSLYNSDAFKESIADLDEDWEACDGCSVEEFFIVYELPQGAKLKQITEGKTIETTMVFKVV